MAKQLLIYDRVVPVSRTQHKELSVKAGGDFSFAKELNSVPLTAIEFPDVAREFAIVFAGEKDGPVPVAIMGIKNNENRYITDDNKLDASYIPAFLRRYPFVYASQPENTNFTLCIDEAFSGCNKDNVGERLFDANGEQTVYLKKVLGFLNQYQAHFNRTTVFCKKLVELDLLETMHAKIRPVDGKEVVLTGFQVINKKKLKELTPDQIHTLLKTDELELVFLHLQSLKNMERFIDSREETTTDN